MQVIVEALYLDLEDLGFWCVAVTHQKLAQGQTLVLPIIQTKTHGLRCVCRDTHTINP